MTAKNNVIIIHALYQIWMVQTVQLMLKQQGQESHSILLPAALHHTKICCGSYIPFMATQVYDVFERILGIR